LVFTITSLEKTMCDLDFHAKVIVKGSECEIFSFMPLTKDDWLTRVLMDHDITLLRCSTFYRGEEDDGKLTALKWMYETGENFGRFDKVA